MQKADLWWLLPLALIVAAVLTLCAGVTAYNNTGEPVQTPTTYGYPSYAQK